MRICTRLSDRMPAVARGEANWSAAEQDHLQACGDCRAEWSLIQVARELGAAEAAKVDPDQLAARVLRSVGQRRRPPVAGGRRMGWLTGLAAAAAVALLVWGNNGRQGGEETAFLLPVAELDSLDVEELEMVLAEFDGPIGGENQGGLDLLRPVLDETDEVGDTQLERVLRSLEG